MSYPRKLDPNKCKTVVPISGMRMNYHQCEKPLWKDGCCKVHHPETVEERRRKAQEKYDARWARDPAKLYCDLRADVARLLIPVLRKCADWPMRCDFSDDANIALSAFVAAHPEAKEGHE